MKAVCGENCTYSLMGAEFLRRNLATLQYLLEKFGRKCAYCGAENIPDLEVEHIIPKTRGGSDCFVLLCFVPRNGACNVSNLTIACKKCNLKKGDQTAEEFGHPFVQEQAKKPLKDAASMNATRWEIYQRLQATGLPIEVGTGGLTKFNRIKKSISPLRALVNSLPKTHWLDAACVGKSTPETLKVLGICPLTIVASGHGSRQMCRVDKYGFSRTIAKRLKRVHGFQTGDMVKSVVKTGKKSFFYIGSIAVRASGSFNIKTEIGTIQGINYQYCQMLQRADGYNYEERGTALPPVPLNGTGFRA